MRTVLILALAIAVLVGMPVAAASARGAQVSQETARRIRVGPTDLNEVKVRQKPTTQSPVVATVRPGEEYASTQVRDGWYFIPAKKGWLAGLYVVVLGPNRSATPARPQPKPTSAGSSASTVRSRGASPTPQPTPIARGSAPAPKPVPTPSASERPVTLPPAAQPTDYDGLVGRVAALLQDGRTEDALPYALELMRLNTNRYESHLYLGIVRFRQGSVSDAEQLLAEGLRLAPDDRKARVKATLEVVTKNARFTQLIASAEAAAAQGLHARAAQSYTDAWNLDVGRDDIGLRAAKLWSQIGEQAVAASTLYAVRARVKDGPLSGDVNATLTQMKPLFDKAYQEKDCARKSQFSSLTVNDQLVLRDCAALVPDNTAAARAMARHFAAANDYREMENWIRIAAATGQLRRNDVLRDPSGNFAPVLADDRFIALIRDIFGSAAADDALLLRAEHARETAALQSLPPGDRLAAALALNNRSPHTLPDAMYRAIRAAEVAPLLERTQSVFAKTQWTWGGYTSTIAILPDSTCAGVRVRKESIERDTYSKGTPNEYHSDTANVTNLTLDLRGADVKHFQSLNNSSDLWLVKFVQGDWTTTSTTVFPRSYKRQPEIKRSAGKLNEHPPGFYIIRDVPLLTVRALVQPLALLIQACAP